MSLTTYPSTASSRGPHSGIPPVAWMVAGITAMGVARATEGMVDLGREVLGIGTGGADVAPERAARLRAERAPREMAACFLIAASLYGVHFVHRAAAEIRGLAHDISR